MSRRAGARRGLRASESRLPAVRLLHPFPSLLVAGLTMALIPLADRGAPGSLYLQLGLGMLCFQFAIGIVNDIADIEEDRAAKPWKPLPSGVVSRQVAIYFAAVFAGAGLVITLRLPGSAWLLGLAGLTCGLAYDLAFKRTALSWAPWSLALPLIPAWVFTAAGRWEPLLWWTFPLGVLLGLALHLANQAPDARGGRREGLPGILGPARSIRLALALFGLAASAATLILLASAPGRATLVAAVAALALFLAPRAVRFFGRDGLFGLLAASAAALAVLFLSAV